MIYRIITHCDNIFPRILYQFMLFTFITVTLKRITGLTMQNLTLQMVKKLLISIVRFISYFLIFHIKTLEFSYSIHRILLLKLKKE